MKYAYTLIAALLFAITRVFAASPLSFPGASSARIGIYIENLATGKVETDFNARESFVPASVMKCITSATAQMSLRPDFVFKTTVRPVGKIINGVLVGNLIVIGGGDPTLASRHFPEHPSFQRRIVTYLQKLGVDSISGDIIVDDSCYPAIGISPFWLQEDIAWEYGAGLYGINFMDNSFSLTVKPGVEASSTQVEVINKLKRDKVGEVVAMRAYDSPVLTLTGSITGPSYTTRYSMPAPSFSLYTALAAEMTKAGIHVAGEPVEATGNCAEPFVFTSPLRDEILRSLMVHSNNLFAEGMLRATVLRNSETDRDFDDAVAQETKLWRANGIDLSGCRLLDGCGLAPVQRITPKALASVLSFMARSNGASNYVALFPRAGVEGTVRSLLAKTPLAGKMALKSGSMNSVVCYAGFKLGADDKPTHVIVIMVNGFSCSSSAVRKSISTYLQSLSNL
ncbi:MAG: D-alanyl-D-alanine carboxypeptidase/D-alanyl-D-alanine-endopeptidase [Muribaculum sp.]|nr:D-alanyl-D-alanine carboxypeptidase/D-alanyl-D-alanine-endopeptidase [Muribaculaceae bacterium]MCM1081403.1 D-alanyl-D-alanine carboxypeptidase/D-alanyl-D-alanine-endopeptidase [Muribaculum sp.]